MNKEIKAKILMIIIMITFGTMAPFVRNINVSSSELALYRALLEITLVGLFILITKQKFDFERIKKEMLVLLLSGAFMGINWILLFEAYKYTTVSVATLSYYFAPVLVMIISPVIFKEKITIKQMICFIFSTIGIVLITGTAAGGKNDFLGILFGLGAAILYATVTLLNKFIKGVDGIQRTFIQFISAIIILFPYVLLNEGLNFSTLTSLGWFSLLVIGVVHTGIAYCVYFSIIEDLSGQQVALLSYIDPLVAVLVSVVVLHEPIHLIQCIGGLLILGFTLYSELPTKS